MTHGILARRACATCCLGLSWATRYLIPQKMRNTLHPVEASVIDSCLKDDWG